MSKKEEGKLSFVESIQLRLHLSICDYCTRFKKQLQLLTGNVPHTHEHVHRTMNNDKKEQIKEMLKEDS